MTRFLFLLGAASVAQAKLQKGVDIHCVGIRAHALHYEVEGEETNGDSLAEVRSAQINMEPLPSRDDHCLALSKSENRSQEVCYGVNQDASCAAAKADVPLESGVDCKNCFLGAEAGLFYSLNYTMLEVNAVAVGFRGMTLKGALELHTSPSASKVAMKGSKVLRDNQATRVVHTLVGCPVCVRVSVSVAMPTTLDYSLALNDAADLTVGAEMEVEIGDMSMTWEKKHGWKKSVETKPTMTMSPVLSGNVDVRAQLGLQMSSSLQVDIDKLLWYHVDMAPSFPTRFELKDSSSTSPTLCSDSHAEFSLSHEADLHVSMFNKTHEFKHWGPVKDFSKGKRLHKCVDVPTDEGLVIV
mmetsp:Transcript_22710/g.40563  ORF Transcript_22710/g.40563 Transcript_22710/m.40563 type:complete len:355 (-) Transcript_22710:24-1088(-)